MILSPWFSLWTPFMLSPSPCFGQLRWSHCMEELYVRVSCTGVKIKDMVADATMPGSCAFKSHSLCDLSHPV